jgi:hypothetical protein
LIAARKDDDNRLNINGKRPVSPSPEKNPFSSYDLTRGIKKQKLSANGVAHIFPPSPSTSHSVNQPGSSSFAHSSLIAQEIPNIHLSLISSFEEEPVGNTSGEFNTSESDCENAGFTSSDDENQSIRAGVGMWQGWSIGSGSRKSMFSIPDQSEDHDWDPLSTKELEKAANPDNMQDVFERCAGVEGLEGNVVLGFG